MINSKFKLIILFTGLSLLLSSCCPNLRDSELNKHYEREGFLNNDYLQIISTGKPEKDIKGLVAMRKSSVENAKKAIHKNTIEFLEKYIINFNKKKYGIVLNKSNEEKILSKIRETELNRFSSYGKIALTYYNSDNSAVIIYRIKRCGIIKEIESISLIKKEKDK